MSLLGDYFDTPKPRVAADLAQVSAEATELSISDETKGLERLRDFTAVTSLFARKAPPATLDDIAALPRLAHLRLFGTKAETLDWLPRGLRTLSLQWAPNLTDLGPLAALQSLAILALGDFKRAENFDPVGQIHSLRALATLAGVWSDQPIRSLDFLTRLPNLAELRLSPIKLLHGDLRPLGRLTGLASLHLPNAYPVREFARLKVCLPDTQCPCFQPWAVMRTAAGLNAEAEDGFDWVEEIMLIGKPVQHLKPNDPKKQEKMDKRARLFAAWEAHYRTVPDPLADETERLG